MSHAGWISTDVLRAEITARKVHSLSCRSWHAVCCEVSYSAQFCGAPQSLYSSALSGEHDLCPGYVQPVGIGSGACSLGGCRSLGAEFYLEAIGHSVHFQLALSLSGSVSDGGDTMRFEGSGEGSYVWEARRFIALGSKGTLFARIIETRSDQLVANQTSCMLVAYAVT